MSRQNYYRARKVRQRRDIDEYLILSLAKQERLLQPMIGCKKLLEVIGPDLSDSGVSIGRDRFIEVMREEDMLIKRKKRYVTTTDSRHSFNVYGNLLKDRELHKSNEAYVSDITYIRTDEGFVYLALMMDAYSRKIVGYDCSDSLEAEGCMRALDSAIKHLPKGCNPIHHSDRGIQYCCHGYVNMLKEARFEISMTEKNHCYENAKAERLNGILKHEYGLCNTFAKKEYAYRAVDQAIELYNNRRPHVALGYRTPAMVHIAA